LNRSKCPFGFYLKDSNSKHVILGTKPKFQCPQVTIYHHKHKQYSMCQQPHVIIMLVLQPCLLLLNGNSCFHHDQNWCCHGYVTGIRHFGRMTRHCNPILSCVGLSMGRVWFRPRWNHKPGPDFRVWYRVQTWVSIRETIPGKIIFLYHFYIENLWVLIGTRVRPKYGIQFHKLYPAPCINWTFRSVPGSYLSPYPDPIRLGTGRVRVNPTH
jgi:hypothetical protein